MKLDAKTIIALVGLAVPPLCGWIEMRVAVARLEAKLEAVSVRVGHIEQTINPGRVAQNEPR